MDEPRKPRATTDGNPPRDGHWDGPAPAPIDPATGQHGAYWVLPEAERAKGFVRPVRTSYRHVGVPAPGNLRDLTPEEAERYAEFGYIKYEEYPASDSCVTGRFWTQKQLDSLGGCGSVTTMGSALAETYARDPKYYGATFCCHCQKHLPVGEKGEFIWETDRTRVGT